MAQARASRGAGACRADQDAPPNDRGSDRTRREAKRVAAQRESQDHCAFGGAAFAGAAALLRPRTAIANSGRPTLDPPASAATAGQPTRGWPKGSPDRETRRQVIINGAGDRSSGEPDEPLQVAGTCDSAALGLARVASHSAPTRKTRSSLDARDQRPRSALRRVRLEGRRDVLRQEHHRSRGDVGAAKPPTLRREAPDQTYKLSVPKTWPWAPGVPSIPSRSAIGAVGALNPPAPPPPPAPPLTRQSLETVLF